MTTQLTSLRLEVNNLAEAFSEVEETLTPEVYNVFAKPLSNLVSNIDAALAQGESMSALIRILALITKYPHIRIATDRLEQWERLSERNHASVRNMSYEPLNMPDEDMFHEPEPQVVVRNREEPGRGGVRAARAQAVPAGAPVDPWSQMVWTAAQRRAEENQMMAADREALFGPGNVAPPPPENEF